MYQVSRQQIIDAARSFLGVRYRHQGRDPETGLDCVGYLKAVAMRINYPFITDVEGYKRTVSYEVLYGIMVEILDEIPVEEALPGDFYFMRMGSKIRPHVAVKVSDTRLIHAYNDGVNTQRIIEHPIEIHARYLFKGFRARGVTD